MTRWTKIDLDCPCVVAPERCKDRVVIRVISRCLAQSLLQPDISQEFSSGIFYASHVGVPAIAAIHDNNPHGSVLSQIHAGISAIPS